MAQVAVLVLYSVHFKMLKKILNHIKMKNYLIISLLAAAFLSCKKDNLPGNVERTMPVEVVRVNQKLTEISKTVGNTVSIVLIGGHGSELKTWQKLYEMLPANSTVFTYNRAGMGASETIAGPRDAKTITIEMKIVLEANNIRPPYIFVAHSMGGIYARMFSHINPGKVKGIVMVDATHEDQLDSLLNMIPQPDRELALAGLAAANDSLLNTFPEGAVKEEFRANFTTNYQQIRQYTGITNMPIYVVSSVKITPDNPPFVADIHKRLHERWALAAGTNGKFVATSSSGHYIQVEEPGLVAEGVRWVLSK
jgi:pimeloyl-ACP methyl ester carboxylesterase